MHSFSFDINPKYHRPIAFFTPITYLPVIETTPDFKLTFKADIVMLSNWFKTVCQWLGDWNIALFQLLEKLGDFMPN